MSVNPTPAEAAGIAWRNRLTKAQRRYWLDVAGSARRRSMRSGRISVETMNGPYSVSAWKAWPMRNETYPVVIVEAGDSWLDPLAELDAVESLDNFKAAAREADDVPIAYDDGGKT